MTDIRLVTFADSQSLGWYAADLFTHIAHTSVTERGRFLVALSGGGTPNALYQMLARPPYRQSLPWEKMVFFWGDERCVPPDDLESSYNQARKAFLGQVPVPVENIQRAQGELPPPEAAREYARQLKTYAEAEMDWPRFDLVLLGLGADGHTASLFPGSMQPMGTAVVAVQAVYQDRPAERISMTPAVFNSAHNVIFLVTGVEKSAALAATLTGSRDPLKYPAQRIDPADGQLWFLADEAAASQLPDVIPDVTIRRS